MLYILPRIHFSSLRYAKKMFYEFTTKSNQLPETTHDVRDPSTPCQNHVHRHKTQNKI